KPRSTTERLLFAALLLACGWAVVYHLAVDVLPYDDAYITFRYADRLAAGEGLTYNDGERVFGSSTPLYTFWLAALRTLLPRTPTPALAVRGNLLFYLACTVCAVGLAGALSGKRTTGLLAGIVFALHPSMQSLSGGGMETFLFASLLAGAVWAA